MINTLSQQNSLEFEVGESRVDLTRSQIEIDGRVVAMQPKVLKVLHLLAQHQGQVVTHSDILASVWPDSQVEPNTIQRCIVQLRKAFGDTAKTQQVIATHPTVGYSLVAPVKWVGLPVQPHDAKETALKSTVSRGYVALLSLASAILVPFLVDRFSPKELQLGHLSLLTSTDNKEYAPAISPDGKHLLFQRHLGGCKSQIMAINTKHNREYLITEEAGIYGRPAWSPNGQKIAFPSAQHCDLEKENSGCREVRTVSFPLAKVTPQKSKQLIGCDNENFDSLVWVTDNQIAFLASDLESTRVKLFNADDSLNNQQKESKEKFVILHQDQKYRPYSIDYSPSLNKLFVMEKEAEQSPRITLIDMKNLNNQPKNKEHIPVTLPADFIQQHHWEIAWHPQRQTLVSMGKSSLFEFDLAGNVTEYPQPFTEELYSLDIDNSSSKIYAAIGKNDTDIGALDLSSLTDTEETSLAHQSNTISRSPAIERAAQLQPAGNKLAFISNRIGQSRIWLKNALHSNDSALPLSNSSHLGSDITTFLWSLDGQSIIYLQDGHLRLTDLQGEETSIETPFKVLNLYQNLPNDELLLNIIHEGKNQVVLFNLRSGKVDMLYQGSSRWAQLNEDNTLYITGVDAIFYSIKDKVRRPLIEHKDHLNWHKFFIRKNNLIFLGEDKRLISYSLSSRQILRSTKLGWQVHRISDIDINQNKILFSHLVSSDNEIAVLYE